MMKTHPPKYYLNTLSNNGLETLSGKDIDNTFQEIYEAEMKKKKAQIMKRLDEQAKQFKKITTFIPRTPLCQTFKKPSSPVTCKNNLSPGKYCEPVICIPNTVNTGGNYYSRYTRSLLQTPKLKDVKLINLSYSQPSTPKVSCSRPPYNPCQTPSVLNRNNNGSSVQSFDIPLTPLLNDPLNVFAQKPAGQESCPLDILQMIDDDSKPVEFVDKELHRYTDVTLSDTNVADYLLDIAEDYTTVNFTTTTVATHPQQQSSSEELNTKRKCRRAKPVSYEESLVYQQQKKERDCERRKKRKESFLKQPSGTRRSQRLLSKNRLKYA